LKNFEKFILVWFAHIYEIFFEFALSKKQEEIVHLILLNLIIIVTYLMV